MRRPDVLKAAFEAFIDCGDDTWQGPFLSMLSNNGFDKDELETMADFCEQAAVVVSLFMVGEIT